PLANRDFQTDLKGIQTRGNSPAVAPGREERFRVREPILPGSFEVNKSASQFGKHPVHGDYTSFGRRECHSVSRSYMRAIRSNFSSSNGGACNCSPIGSPELVKPHGMLMPVIPARLAPIV